MRKISYACMIGLALSSICFAGIAERANQKCTLRGVEWNEGYLLLDCKELEDKIGVVAWGYGAQTPHEMLTGCQQLALAAMSNPVLTFKVKTQPFGGKNWQEAAVICELSK
jgi:hypothetical protein